MTAVYTDVSSDQDGSGAPITATGAIIVTYSGTKGDGENMLTLMSRSDTADYVNTFATNKFGRYKINLANNDQFYFILRAGAGASIDVSYVFS